jgi:hypothetical protein
MLLKYADWICEWCFQNNTTGKCEIATIEMLKNFPELIRVRGHYYCSVWGEREHWWLETSEGGVIDPTASQFPTRGHGVYVPWDESQPEPTGRCPNCGEYSYNGETCCSDLCSTEFRASLYF